MTKYIRENKRSVGRTVGKDLLATFPPRHTLLLCLSGLGGGQLLLLVDLDLAFLVFSSGLRSLRAVGEVTAPQNWAPIVRIAYQIRQYSRVANFVKVRKK